MIIIIVILNIFIVLITSLFFLDDIISEPIFIFFQVPPNHLLSASVMSAPAALAMSKLFYPETKKSKHRAEDVYKMPKGSVLSLFTVFFTFEIKISFIFKTKNSRNGCFPLIAVVD